jgi:hypothetical protein
LSFVSCCLISVCSREQACTLLLEYLLEFHNALYGVSLSGELLVPMAGPVGVWGLCGVCSL